MVQIIELASRRRKTAPSGPKAGQSASILLFTGVRYERILPQQAMPVSDRLAKTGGRRSTAH